VTPHLTSFEASQPVNQGAISASDGARPTGIVRGSRRAVGSIASSVPRLPVSA
jgi:hypothetical protein